MGTVSEEVRNALFYAVRSGLELDPLSDPPSPELFDDLFRISAGQSILPIVYHGLKRAGLLTGPVREYEEDRLKDVRNTVLRDHLLQIICDALSGNGIPYILLKGAVIRNLYPDPNLRTSSDIDILVRDDDLEKAVGALEKDTDLRYLRRSYHNVTLYSGVIHLELHFSLLENVGSLDRLLKEAWKYAVPTGDGSRYDFTPEYQLFYVMAHMSHHFLIGGLGIRPFLDLWLLRTGTEFDEEEVRRMCAECGILTFYTECSHLSRVWLEGEKHTEATALLEEVSLSGGVFGSRKFKNAGRQRKQKKLGYILSRVFPPADQVREYYGDPSAKKHSKLYYYVKRLRSWTSSARRKELGQQIGTVMKSDKKYLQKTGRLFQLLDLEDVR